jgi:hypothetical protein
VKIILSLLLLLLPSAVCAQQIITVDTCTYAPATGTLTINGVPVVALSLAKLALTGGAAYADGQYLVQIASGALTFTPYTSAGGGAATNFVVVAIGPSTAVIASYGNRPQGFVIPAGTTKVWIANLEGAYSTNLAYPWDFGWVVTNPATATTPGAGIVYAKNVSLTAYQFTGATVTLGME